MINFTKEVSIAAVKIRPFVRETPLDYSIPLSQITGSKVYIKCENLQYTGAFKVRGAINKLLSLNPCQSKLGVVTASTGNHGAAVAYVLNKLGMKGIVFVPENASNTKVENIKNYNVPVEFHATDCMAAEMHAIEYSRKHNMIYVSPYNDIDVIVGQGTIGLEIWQQLNAVDYVLVPIGGGGLISGIAGYLKSVSPNTKIIGCLPTNSPVMSASIKAGKIIDMETLPTLSDATAGGIEADAITFPLCQQYVDDYINVTEDEIKNALVTAIKTQHLLLEGAAGVALGALLKNAEGFEGKNVVVVLSGGNISVDTLRLVLES